MAGAVIHKDLPLAPIFIVVLCATGCVRRDGRNSDCRWPAETGEHPASAWHLSMDAEFAEDLAIRYADVHYWHTPYWAEYDPARDRCMGTLFEQVAKEHGVPVERVYSSLGHNRPYFDLAEALSFALLYCFVAAAGARLIWQRYPFADAWIPCVLINDVLSFFRLRGCGNDVWPPVVRHRRKLPGRQRPFKLPRSTMVLVSSWHRVVRQHVHPFLVSSGCYAS